MTRKDYVQFAAMLKYALAKTETVNEAAILQGLAQDMANMFHADNERFDYRRFYKACGESCYESLVHPNSRPEYLESITR